MSSRKDYPTDAEIRSLQDTIYSGIILAQQRLVQRAEREGFTLISCLDGHHITERDPKTVVF